MKLSGRTSERVGDDERRGFNGGLNRLSASPDIEAEKEHAQRRNNQHELTHRARRVQLP
jgi:hypothetical protein